MANQYSKMTKANVIRKINRKSNPVQSVSQLAREFGVGQYTRTERDWYGREGQAVIAPSPTFRNQVRTMIGARAYAKLSARK